VITLEWFGCTTFRIRRGGLTLFFDTYLDKAPRVPGVSLRAADVADADLLFITHAHFDHVLGADVIATATGATVVGNAEVANLMERSGLPPAQVLAVSGGETVHCDDDVRVRVFPALHSCLFAAAGSDSGASCLGDLGIGAQERRDRARQIFEVLPTLDAELGRFFDDAHAHVSDRDGGQLAFLLEAPEGSILVNASSGYWRPLFADLRPDVALLAAAGRPNVDGEPHQGSMAEFLVEQAELLGRPAVALCHHDPLLPPLVPGVDTTAAADALRTLLGPDRYLELGLERPIELFGPPSPV
jgi:L-ascorbate metabolism protein UlaG (beta-lactamase superfamily)